MISSGMTTCPAWAWHCSRLAMFTVWPKRRSLFFCPPIWIFALLEIGIDAQGLPGKLIRYKKRIDP